MSHSACDTLYLILPCYNEEAVLPETSKRLKVKMQTLIENGRISDKSKIVFVDDGSKDKTYSILRELHESDPIFSCIKLSCNRGHQNALLCGLFTAAEHADMLISMDADLQDDINAIDEMLDKYYGGCDVVYGVRSTRDTDTFFKKFTAEGFYKVMRLLGAKVVFNHADYRLMSRRAVEGLEQFPEVNLFLRGMVPMVGYPSDTVYYARGERFAGESKYPLKKMLSFAFEGITSLSVQPIKLITRLGFLVFLLSGLFLLYSFIRYFTGNTTPGWASLIVSVWAIGGLILMSIGVIGEYIGKVYLETKGRPRFIVEEFLND